MNLIKNAKCTVLQKQCYTTDSLSSEHIYIDSCLHSVFKDTVTVYTARQCYSVCTSVSHRKFHRCIITLQIRLMSESHRSFWHESECRHLGGSRDEYQ